jgi:hypothetical protein
MLLGASPQNFIGDVARPEPLTVFRPQIQIVNNDVDPTNRIGSSLFSMLV